MKLRSEIEDKYKWNLKDIYKNEDAFKLDFEKYKEMSKKIESFKGKLNDINTFYEYLKFEDELDFIGGKVGLYVFLKRDEDISNSKNVEMLNMVSSFQNKVSALISFVEPEILKFSSKYLKQIYADKRFEPYKIAIDDIVRSKAHILDDKTEKLLTKVGEFAGGFSDVYDNMESVDLTYDSFKYKGKVYEVTPGSYSVLRESKIREIRKKSYENMYKAFKNFSNVIATNYIYNVKADWFFAKEHNYESCLDAEFEGRNLNKNIYYNLIKNVDNNLNLAHEYFKILKNQSKLEDFTVYDIYAPLVKYDRTFSVEESKEIVMSALSVLGEDYLKVLKEGLESGWIDYFETKGKATGGYKVSVYGTHPYILLNYEPNYTSLSTLAHELGHACHSYFGYKNNPISTADENLFVAEISSTTNELLLLKYMIKNAKNKQEKLFYLNKFVNDFYATIFTQTMYSKFEVFAHEKIENDESLSKDMLCDYYGKLVESFHGKAVVPHEYSKYAWLRVPHFYRCYYVYKYSTSYAVASFVANKIWDNKDDMLNKYKKFLSAGSKYYPKDVLKIIDVDLEKDDVYNVAFSELKWALDEIKKLTKNSL